MTLGTTLGTSLFIIAAICSMTISLTVATEPGIWIIGMDIDFLTETEVDYFGWSVTIESQNVGIGQLSDAIFRFRKTIDVGDLIVRHIAH